MANAYATLASGGIRHKVTGIERVVVFPDGKSERLASPKGKRVMTDGQAYEVTKILEMNVTSGTGTAAGYGCPAAGKTGTTDEAKDAWFVGYTPRLSTAVWVGYPDAGIAMPGAQGGTYAAPVWHAFMLPASDGNCDDFLDRGVRVLALLRVLEHREQLRRRIRRRRLDGPHRVARRHRRRIEYDPNLYESAPQQEPDVQVPPAQEELAPPAGGGSCSAPDG